MINYNEPIRRPLVNKASNEVCKWVFGLEGVCSETGESAYIDAVWDVSDQEPRHYSKWTKAEINAEYGKCEYENGFVDTIGRKIDCKNAKRVEVLDFDYNSASNT
jgi:hypothetical protein